MSRGPRGPATRYVPAVLLFVAGLAAWEALVRVLRVPDIIVPPPSRVAAVLVDGQIDWLHHIGITAFEVVAGFAGAVVLGVGLAVVIVTSRRLGQVLMPYVLLMQIVPKIAFAPIFFLILGYNLLPSIVITFLVAFFPITINTVSGLRAADPRLAELLRSLRGTRWDVLRKAEFPAALPFLFSALKVASTLAVVGANVAEFVSAKAGLGFLIINAQVTFNTGLAFAAATYLILLGVAFYAVIAGAERVLMPWSAAVRTP
jgi:NitT/TauT family transport system permease protein